MNKESFKNYFDLLDTVLEESIRKLVEVAFRKASRVTASAGKKAQGRVTAADTGRYVSLNSTSNSVSLSLQTLYQLVCLVPSHCQPLPLYQLAPH